MSTRRGSRFGRVFNVLLVMLLLLSFTAAGLAKPEADETTTIEVFLPYVIRHGVYQECIGELDTSFSQDGWLLTNYSGSLDYGTAIVMQPDGKLVMAGSFNPTSTDFGLVRFNADGSEDPSFDGDGRVYTDFFGKGDQVNAVAIQSDNKIVAVGSAYYNTENRDEFALARYNPDGSLDADFGNHGLVTTDILGDADYATAVAIQADGKIVVAGYVYNGANYDFALARYTEAGILDGTFSGDGIVVTDLTGQSDRAYALVLAGDKFVLAGEARNGTSYDFALARYNADGIPDTGFDGDGIVFTDFDTQADGGRAVVALQQDGNLVVAGFAKVGDNNNFALVRYNSNGSPDTTFGDGGMVTTDFYGGNESGSAILLEPISGDLVVGGYIWDGIQNDFALARYTSSGTLDTTFGVDGMVVTDFNGHSEWGYGMVWQGDGKLILAGYMYTVAGSDFAMARYYADGILDLGFSEDGWVVTNLFGSNDQGLAAAMQPDGKLVVAGWVEGLSDTDFAVARYYSDGSRDLSFDNDGRLVTDINGDYDYAYAVAIQQDGKIVVAGTAFNTDGWNDDFALVRYKSDGSLDLEFGVDGRVISDYGGDDNGIHALLVLPDGKLMVAGYVYNGEDYDFALARYNSDGTLDTNFGTVGWVLTDFFDDDDYGWAIARQADGKLLVAGYATNGTEYDFALARYTASGILDDTFDGDGRVVTDINVDDQGHAIAVQEDGKILVAGWSNNGTQDDFAIVRYDPNGGLDNTFDGDGRVVTDIKGNYDRLTAIGLQPNGKIMVAGMVYSSVEAGYDLALARYLANGSLDPDFSTDGWLTLDFYAGDDSGQALLMQPNGKVVLAGYADNGTDYDFALARYR